MAKLSEILLERGYVYQFSSENLEEITDGQPRTLYLGVDPTADSMHLGQLQGIMVLRRFVEAGHKLIVLIGDGTGMVGDPGGKSAERNLLEQDVVAHNAEALRMQFSRLLGGIDFEMVRNSTWLHALNYMEFLRDIGKHFTVNEMIKRDSVRPRIETPDQSISYTEFSYMLLQAYDYLTLHETHGCDLQVGGSDQWGNIVSGVDLIRRKTGDRTYAFSWPLLVDKKSGKKFGKSEGNAVWLNAEKTSPFQFYQFWLNADDAMLEELLLKMTMLPKEQINAEMEKHAHNPAERSAQKALAFEVTALVHGEDVAMLQESLSSVLFSTTQNSFAPTAEVALMLKEYGPAHRVHAETSIVDVIVEAGLAGSKREARDFIANNAIVLNGVSVTDTSTLVREDSFTNGIALLKRGKRNVCILVLE